MPERTAEAAGDAFVEAQRQTLSCIARGTVYGSGNEPGQEQILAIWGIGQREPNLLRLTTHQGIGEIAIGMTINYVIDSFDLRTFGARTIRYRFRIVDIADRELVIYDWHPFGPSSFTRPHLHVPDAGAVTLAQRPGTPRSYAKTYLGSLHLPTGLIDVSAVVSMLITEFRVDPLRADWERILHGS